MIAKKPLMLLLAFALTTLANASEKPVLAALNAEAQAMQTNVSAWAALNSKADEICDKNEARGGFTEVGIVPADLRPAKFPLEFLVWRLQNGQANHNREVAYLNAIAASSDERRIPALLELRPEQDPYDSWGYYLTEAATPEWAFQQIREAVATNAAAPTYSLAFQLLYRFGQKLPSSLTMPAYDLIRRAWPKGPTNGDGESYFEVLLKIDRDRARRELISYYGKPESPRRPEDRSYDLYVVTLLDKYKGPSPTVAATARKWLAESDSRDREIYGVTLKRLILFSDPEHEIKPTLGRIKELLRTQKKPNNWSELDTLVHAVLELGLPKTADNLANFAEQPAIPDITRFDIVDWLVQQRYPRLPEIFAWWLRSDHSEWIQNEAKRKWGDYGKQLLDAGNKINQRRTAQQLK